MQESRPCWNKWLWSHICFACEWGCCRNSGRDGRLRRRCDGNGDARGDGGASVMGRADGARGRGPAYSADRAQQSTSDVRGYCGSCRCRRARWRRRRRLKPVAPSRLQTQSNDDGWTVQEGRKRTVSASPSRTGGKVMATAAADEATVTASSRVLPADPTSRRQRTRPLQVASGRPKHQRDVS